MYRYAPKMQYSYSTGVTICDLHAFMHGVHANGTDSSFSLIETGACGIKPDA